MIQDSRKNIQKERRLRWKVIQHHEDIIKDIKAEDLALTIW